MPRYRHTTKGRDRAPDGSLSRQFLYRQGPSPHQVERLKPVGPRFLADPKLDNLYYRWLLRREDRPGVRFPTTPEWITLRDELARRIASLAAVPVEQAKTSTEKILHDLVENHEEYEMGDRSLVLVEMVASTAEALAICSAGEKELPR